jgi:hypothetical protein
MNVSLRVVEKAKNGRTAMHPFPPDVVEVLRDYLSDRAVDRPIWPGNWRRKATGMVRLDLAVLGLAPSL